MWQPAHASRGENSAGGGGGGGLTASVWLSDFDGRPVPTTLRPSGGQCLLLYLPQVEAASSR